MPNANYVHVITLYNCLKATDSPDKKEHWYRYVLHDCFYKAGMTVTQDGTQAKQSNTYTVRIPESVQYKPYREWVALAEEERKNCFTVSLGDLVVKGDWMDTIDKESGISAAQILVRCKPDAFRVTAFSDNAKNLFAKHYRLGG